LGGEAGIPELALNSVEGVDRHHGALRVVRPALHRQRWLVHEWRQVEKVIVRGVLDIEEALLPLLARFKHFHLGEVRALPGHDGGRAALGHGAVLLLLRRFRRVILAPGLLLDNLLSQLEVLRPGLGERLYAGEAFAEGSEGGEDHHRVRQDMVGLQLVGVEEVPEEV
jgi:hypothetical protein